MKEVFENLINRFGGKDKFSIEQVDVNGTIITGWLFGDNECNEIPHYGDYYVFYQYCYSEDEDKLYKLYYDSDLPEDLSDVDYWHPTDFEDVTEEYQD